MSDESGNAAEQKSFSVSRFELVTIVVCAALCILFMRIPFLSMLHLAPLGCAIIMLYNRVKTPNSYIIVFAAAISAHIIICAVTNTFFPLDILYIAGMFFIFSWMMGGRSVRGLYRFFITVIAGTIGYFVITSQNESLNMLFEQIIAELAPGISVSDFMETVNIVLYRGGALVSMCLMLFVNRQLASAAAWIIVRQRINRKLTEFFAPQGIIWVLSGAIATIMLALLFGIVILEIIAWNVLIICVIIYLAQGAGILMHILTKRSSAFKMGAAVLAVILILSPFSIMAVAAMLILGIAENWIPIRLKTL